MVSRTEILADSTALNVIIPQFSYMGTQPTQIMSPQENKTSIAHHSTLYQQFLEERNEILKHKWLLSENAGKDIGFEAGLLDWVRRYRSSCKASRPVGLANDPQTRLPLPGVAGEEGFLPTLSIPRNK